MCVRKVACFSRLGRSLALPTVGFSATIADGTLQDHLEVHKFV